MNRPETWIIDIDGTILELLDSKSPSDQWHSALRLLPGSREFLDELEKKDHTIILMTARPESFRETLVSQLRASRIIYHQLVMGVTSGMRHLVNDKKPNGLLTARAHNVTRNYGLRELM